MHIADTDIGILGANGIVGGGIPIAGGAALSAQKRGTDQVCLCFFGDGASNTTRFHEGVNLASIWKLPVVYVIENNLYGETTHVSYAMNVPNVADRACAYGIPGKIVDGNDVLAVYEAVGEAVERARKGEGPTIVECKTYRWHGHYIGDPETYKSKEEVAEWKKRDPIPRFRKYLIENNVLAEEDANKIEKEISDEIDNAVKFAEESPLPEPEETLEGVYA
jgi:pyruvate dehydrogenase E1 component alpha subunit